ncbi:MAG: MFS transporter [Chloroflexi bacterium]|nr:MFS transporter [Chloroflexota bacterium]
MQDGPSGPEALAPPSPVAVKRRSWLGATFRALENRNYRLYWSGQLVSLTGSWMQRTAVAWLVLELTDSPLALGTVTMLQFLPMLLFSLVGGVLADRWPKRRVLLVTQVGSALQATALALLVSSGQIDLWHLYALSFIQGLFQAVDNPTRAAFAAELVGPDHLANAIALNSGNFNASRIFGPALAGALLATVGTAVCFWANALSYVPIVWGLLAMRPEEFHMAPPARGSVYGQLVEGLAYAVRTPAIFGVLVIVWALGTFGFNFITIIPLLARFVFDAGPEAYGLLSSCLGAGSLCGALLAAGRARATRGWLFFGAAVFTVLLGSVALSSWYALSAVLLFALGMAGITFSATAQTLLQYAAPGQMRGRVMSLYTVLFAGTTPLGALVVGGLSESYSVPAALLVTASLCALGTATAWLYLRYRGSDSP